MKIVVKILLTLLFFGFTVIANHDKKSKESDDVLKCYGCEMSNFTGKSCNFSYECQSHEFCETLISRVDGHELTVVLSCASEERCLAENSIKSLGDCNTSK